MLDSLRLSAYCAARRVANNWYNALSSLERFALRGDRTCPFVFCRWQLPFNYTRSPIHDLFSLTTFRRDAHRPRLRWDDHLQNFCRSHIYPTEHWSNLLSSASHGIESFIAFLCCECRAWTFSIFCLSLSLSFSWFAWESSFADSLGLCLCLVLRENWIWMCSWFRVGWHSIIDRFRRYEASEWLWCSQDR